MRPPFFFFSDSLAHINDEERTILIVWLTAENLWCGSIATMSSATEARNTTGRDKGQKMAWGSARADDVVPPDENKPLADRILTLGPLTAAISATRRHPRFFDMILYVAFLALLTYVVMKAQDLDGAWPSSTPYLSARLIHQRYGDKFLKIETIGQWFDYMEQDLLPIIYPLAWYNGKEISKPDLGFAGAGRNSPDNFRIVGAVQVRQIRTQKSTCPRTFQQELRNLVLSCVGEYSKVTQEQVPYGPREKGQYRYSFTSSIENGENSYTGIFSTYDGGGYVTTLPADGSEETKNRTLAKIKQMRTDLWVDRQTRAIFVTVNLFNPTTGYITALRLMLEHPASGGLHPSVSMRHVPIGALYTSYAKLSLVLPEGLLTVAVIFYMFWEFNQASTVTFTQYFSHFWGIFDWINFVLFILAYSFRWAAYDKAKILNFPPINEKFVNFETSAWHVQMWRNTLAVNLIICYLKLFKYSSQIPSLAHLFKKIFFTMIDFFYVLLSFIFIYFGFTLSHFLAYGDQIASCRTIPDTMVMLWKHMLGYFSPGVEEMVEANRFLGPLFFVVFTSTVSIVLLTYFLGLLRESYVLAGKQQTLKSDLHCYICFAKYIAVGTSATIQYMLRISLLLLLCS